MLSFERNNLSFNFERFSTTRNKKLQKLKHDLNIVTYKVRTGQVRQSCIELKTPGTLQTSVLIAVREMNSFEEGEEVKKKMQVLLEKIKNSMYAQCEFKREKIRDWKTKYEDHFRKENNPDFPFCEKVSRPSLVSNEMVTKIKSILINLFT